jgi:TPR repeat protein
MLFQLSFEMEHALADTSRKCDLLAANPFDKRKVSDGVKLVEIDPSAAIPACLFAVKENPENLRYQYQLARAYFKDSDYDNSIKFARGAATKGYAPAQSALGQHYEIGEGVTKNFNEAIKWYRKAAGQGYALAQNNLGNLFAVGNGTKQDWDKAFQWISKAADQGLPISQVHLGSMYERGEGVTVNHEKSFEWYKLAADQENYYAMVRLGHKYVAGKGVKKNNNEAFTLYKIAAENGLPEGANSLGYMYEFGLGISKNIIEAINWYKTSAEDGNRDGQLSLGIVYLNGTGLEKDYKKALKWIFVSSENGNNRATYVLGKMYREGKGVSKDYEKAYRLFKNAADNGSSEAQVDLGYAYESGQGISSDIKRAIRYYRLAAEQGNQFAQYNLGNMYRLGRGISKDFQKAAKWYRLAANQGNAKAKKNLEYMKKQGSLKEIKRNERQVLKNKEKLNSIEKRKKVKSYKRIKKRIIIKAQDFQRSKNVESNVRPIYGPNVILNAKDNPKENLVVYEFLVQKSGYYTLHVEYAAKLSRPVQIRVNNEILSHDSLNQTTGGWTNHNQKWFRQGIVDLQKGKNTLGIYRKGPIPHIRKIKFILETSTTPDKHKHEKLMLKKKGKLKSVGKSPQSHSTGKKFQNDPFEKYEKNASISMTCIYQGSGISTVRWMFDNGKIYMDGAPLPKEMIKKKRNKFIVNAIFGEYFIDFRRKKSTLAALGMKVSASCF